MGPQQRESRFSLPLPLIPPTSTRHHVDRELGRVQELVGEDVGADLRCGSVGFGQVCRRPRQKGQTHRGFAQELPRESQRLSPGRNQQIRQSPLRDHAGAFQGVNLLS